MTLLVGADAIATRLSIPLPLTPTVLARIEAAIEDAQDDVVGFLGRPLTPETVTLEGLYARDGYDLTSIEAWPEARNQINDRYKVESYEVADAEAETFNVTFLVGLDVANDPTLRPILRFIRAAAQAMLRNDSGFVQQVTLARTVASVARGGQSVSYESTKALMGEAGAPPTLDSLSRWKRRAIHQPPSRPLTPWPFADRLL